MQYYILHTPLLPFTHGYPQLMWPDYSLLIPNKPQTLLAVYLIKKLSIETIMDANQQVERIGLV